MPAGPAKAISTWPEDPPRWEAGEGCSWIERQRRREREREREEGERRMKNSFASSPTKVARGE